MQDPPRHAMPITATELPTVAADATVWHIFSDPMAGGIVVQARGPAGKSMRESVDAVTHAICSRYEGVCAYSAALTRAEEFLAMDAWGLNRVQVESGSVH